MENSHLETLRLHLQTAVEIELATIPIYLYTYYSINRIPSNCDSRGNGQELSTFANKAGGLIMSVAVEEMLHMSLACNILRALGGKPKLYQHSPGAFPANLPHHKKDFTVGLEKLSLSQLDKFMTIEKPEAPGAPPEGNNWETIGQFYDYIEELIEKHTTDDDFKDRAYQLKDGDGYYAANNVDTVYPKDAYYIRQPEDPENPSARGAKQAIYPNSEDSGHLVTVKDKASAIKAIQIIKHQGEGYPDDPTHKYDDVEKNEDSHWYKYNELYKALKKLEGKNPAQISCFAHNFPDNPTTAGYAAPFRPLVELANAVYSYLLLITEVSFTLRGDAQHTLFYIGMHKGMIFILDKILGNMRYIALENGNKEVLAPTFENYKFSSLAAAKEELVALAESIPPSLNLDPNIIQRIKNLPDVNVPANGIVQFG